jgi:AAHS family benzoate transporter-like MFS transporter
MSAVGLIAANIDVPAVAKPGEIQQLANVSPLFIGLLLITIAIVGLGTSGTQTLIFGMAANYYRTNVRSAGVAWTAGFGRIGGITGPILGVSWPRHLPASYTAFFMCLVASVSLA